ncbi:MAG: SDR family oxidoreductase [Proteobacteria bacterium]|nr:SDR family oxidoreductase [Pseudomonadota bacterium]
MPLRQQILITGASTGLGRGMALEFAARGRHLALCARRLDLLESLRQEIGRRFPGVRVAVRALDVNDHARIPVVFDELAAEIGGLDRIIVNAGVGRGAPVGTGRFDANLATAQTNFIAALAQCEAAVRMFRDRGAGHLVTICSVAAIRGLPRYQTVYAATKAGLASLTEGIRADLWDSPIRVSAIFPGYIESEISSGASKRIFLVDTLTGCRALVRAIEREPARAFVPPWPWAPVAFLMRHVPLGLLVRMM